MKQQPKTIYLRDYAPPDFTIETIELTFDLGDNATRVCARSQIRRNGSHDRPLRLDGEAMSLVSVAVDDELLAADRYRLDEDGLTIEAVPDAFCLEIETETDPAANTKLEGLYLSNDTYCTQCEAEGFRRITFFLDRPDVMARYRVIIRAAADRCPVLLSNGNRIRHQTLADGRHEAVWEDPFPKPSYLFALVAGDLACVADHFDTRSGRRVALNLFVEHGNEGRASYALDVLKRAMAWDERKYGLEYDLDVFNVVAVSDFNMGAMENKSLNIFNAKFILADPETATDADHAFIESVVAHEYFHNWTGNRITCRDWFQLSLKEGLTVFRDQEFSSDQRSRAVKRIQDVRVLRARQFAEDAGPLAHPVRPDSYIEINNFYTATVYEKGAELVRMAHTLLGEAGFRKGMDLYFARHDGQAVTCDDFVAAMADANDRDLSQFFRWYGRPGTPVVRAEGRHDPVRGTYQLTLTQDSTADGEVAPLHVPIEVALLDGNGEALALTLAGDGGVEARSARLLELTETEQTFTFTGIAAEPVPSLNRGFTAPIRLETDDRPDRLAFLMAHDPDPFNRWDAGQRYATNLLLEAVADIQAGKAPSTDSRFIDALRRTLADPDLDRAFIAHALTLPGESLLAEHMTVVDVTAIHEARQALRQAVAESLADPFDTQYRINRTNQPYSPDAEATGRRALANTALAYLSALDEDSGARAASHYARADNMTDAMAALNLLTHLDCPAREQALADFYQRYHGEALVIDKWFAVQAMSSRPDTLEVVRGLRHHPVFSQRNPNNVRALIATFASANPLRFHAVDGSGYRFLADEIIALDQINPQVAARLVAPLGRWRRFDGDRQAAMRGQLERIVGAPSISRDAYEMADKSLK